ncbi:MAG TPA: NPCBM/NEW2 domain-containing protein [Planctomycetota bacterium]|nr:NPCBM/NEW2 domain-containing protein [Planctomycetota bacterium]
MPRGLFPRASAFVLLVAGLALAAPEAKVFTVDGGAIDGKLLTVESGTAVVSTADGRRQIPVTNLVLATSATAENAPGTGTPFNLYLHGGDRLRGAVTGTGGSVRLDSPVVLGLVVPLDAVRAVRFGRLLGALQASYGEVFEKEFERGRDSIVIQRDTKPFPVPARVLEVGESSLVARIEDARREIEFARVYGFVRTPDRERAEPGGVRVRVYIAGGEVVTLPLERISETAVEGGGVRIVRDHVSRLEFRGDYMAQLADFDPIDVKQTTLFGQPPPWRRDGMALGGPLRLGSQAYERGIGALAYTRLEYVLGGRWETFYARCGIDDAAGPEGDAVFRVLGDGKVLAEMRRRKGEAPEAVRVDVTGVDRLVLEALPGDSYVSDFCDWADARVFSAHDGPSGGK